MILKVQTTIDPSNNKLYMLFYNKSRRIFHEAELTPDVAAKMGDAKKKYFEATVSSNGKEITLIKEVTPQNW